MASMSPGGGPVNPEPPTGWIAQLIAAVQRAVFEPSWAPWVRLIVTAAVVVALYIGIVWATRTPA